MELERGDEREEMYIQYSHMKFFKTIFKIITKKICKEGEVTTVQ